MSWTDRDASPGLDPLADFAASFGRNSPEEAMRLSCERLLRETGQSDAPISLARLLTAVGARQEELPLTSAARLRIDERGYLVGVREGTDWRRRQFSVAHEIGHILICEALRDRPEQLRALREPQHWPDVERLCNRGAAELLMPAADFVAQAGAGEVTAALLCRLRERFGVSWTALAIRFQQLLGFGVSTWTRYRRHEDERVTFRVERSWGKGASWLPVGLTARHLSPNVIEAAATDGEATAEGELALGRKPTRVSLAAISLNAAAESRPAEQFDEVDVPAPRHEKILLFLRPADVASSKGAGPGSPQGSRQMVLVG
jgi:IrrE N-terminal-like domain